MIRFHVDLLYRSISEWYSVSVIYAPASYLHRIGRKEGNNRVLSFLLHLSGSGEIRVTLTSGSLRESIQFNQWHNKQELLDEDEDEGTDAT